MKKIYVDIDVTLADYSKGYIFKKIGKPKLDRVELLRKLYNQGWYIVIYSIRSEIELVPWLKEHNIPYHTIDSSKPKYDIIWDDKSVYEETVVETTKQINKIMMKGRK